MERQDDRHPWMLDEATSFPLSLYPSLEAPNVYTRTGELYHKDPDEHHIFHTKKGYSDPAVGSGGAVVRYSRIQTVRRYHHDAAHAMLAPPPIIQHDKEQFDTSVLSLLNLIPRQVIDVRGDAPELVELDDSEYALLKQLTRSDYSRGFHASIGKFFIHTMVHHYKEAVNEDLKCEFLEAKYRLRKQEIGNRILKLVANEAVSPLLPTYQECKKRGEIPKQQTSPYKTVLKYSRSVARPENVLAAALKIA